MNKRDSYTIEAMEKYGGSFVKALAECFRHADSHNRALIKTTWSQYWSQYERMGAEAELKERAA